MDINIPNLKNELRLRGLMGLLKTSIRKVRPNISDDTIYRAFKVENYEDATPICRTILEHGNKILSDDNLRIKAQVEHEKVFS